MATATCAVFSVHDRRGIDGLRAILGERFAGVLRSDRWGVYGCWDVGKRQLCWAHLKRDFQKCADYGGPAKPIGEGGLNIVLALWAFCQEDGIEPTNNHVERPRRRGVLWQKCSFGSQSAAGGVFVVRLLSAVQSCACRAGPCWAGRGTHGPSPRPPCCFF